MELVMLRSLALILVMGLSGCGLLPDRTEDQQDWSANKFYSEAKAKLNDGSYPAAIKLYESLGYKVVSRRKRYYPDNQEDALVMWCYDLV